VDVVVRMVTWIDVPCSSPAGCSDTRGFLKRKHQTLFRLPKCRYVHTFSPKKKEVIHSVRIVIRRRGTDGIYSCMNGMNDKI
jgi:hypothetical protein